MSKYIENKIEYKVKVRNGLEVKVRDIQEEVLEIMDEIDRICRKYDITYGLIAGSALGIVNYGGFIPWDDDIDVFILRDDWERFVEAIDKELKDKFYYHSYSQDNRYNILIPQMKIRKRDTYVEEENILLDNKCDGNGLFVDVVMYGEVNKSKFVDEVFRTIVKLLAIPTVIIDNLGINPVFFKKMILGVDKFYDKISKGSGLYSQPITIPWEKFMEEPVFRKDDIFPVKEYCFEGRQYYSYNNIEKILKKWYGNNCLKKWNSEKNCFEETLSIDKRVAKHIRDINFSKDVPKNGKYKKGFDLFVRIIFILFILGIVLLFFNYCFIGLLLILIFLVSLYLIVK
jgi:lipopolysaccharide cholinephosphotransferase